MSAGLPPRSAIGPYRVIDHLGAGGMGTVYRVIHRSTGRVAAAKLLNAGPSALRTLERFRNEARILQGLTHPSIAAMHELLDVDGAPCLIMEYVDGETLDQRLRTHGPLPVPEAIRLFAGLVDAVGYIHRRGIIHRDLKSTNVKIDSRGEVKLLDFGIAVAEGGPRLTSTGNVVGTLASLAPEQLRTGRAEARSDIWALGTLLYEMVTGRLPFDNGDGGFIGARILEGRFEPPSAVRPGLPRDIDRIVGRCLRVKPEERYVSANALLADVRALSSGEQAAVPSAVPSSRIPPALDPSALLRGSGDIMTRAAGQWRVLVSALLATAAALFLVWTLRGDPVAPAEPAGDSTAATATLAGTPATGARVHALHIRLLEGTADVFIDGTRVGTTPYTLRAPLGTEVELLLRRSGCDDLRRTLRLEEGMQETIESMSRCSPR